MSNFKSTAINIGTGKEVNYVDSRTPEEVKDSTDNCHLMFVEGVSGLVCDYNHKAGEDCLACKCEYCHELKCKCYEE
jgi:hypothetical protein